MINIQDSRTARIPTPLDSKLINVYVNNGTIV